MAKAGSGSGTGGGESAGPVRNFGAGVLLFTTYALFVVCNTVGTACLPSMIEDVGFSAGTGSTIAGFQTAAQAIGKVTFAGRLADALGGRRTYCMSMAVVAVAIACFAWAPSALAIGVVFFMVELCSTPVYPAHVHFVRHDFVGRTGAGFWLLGLASRSGDVVSKLGWGTLLETEGWRHVALLGAALAALASAFGYCSRGGGGGGGDGGDGGGGGDGGDGGDGGGGGGEQA